MHDGIPSSWIKFARHQSRTAAGDAGKGLHFVVEPTSSPSRADLIRRVLARLPAATVHFFSPVALQSEWEGAQLAFGRVVATRLDLSRADVIVSLDDDFSAHRPGWLRLVRQLADGRRGRTPEEPMNRVYALESTMSVLGSMADHRLALSPSEIPSVAASLAARVLEQLGLAVPAELAIHRAAARKHDRFVLALARDLVAHRGRAAVLVGRSQPAHVHALAHVLNDRLGNIGSTITFTESTILEAGTPSHGLGSLAQELDAGHVDTLVVLGGNPAYSAFADLDFPARVRKAGTVVYVGPYHNETARVASWFIPECHVFESWGDARAADGSVSLVQPLISPVYDSRTVDEALAVYLGRADATPDGRSILREYWEASHPGPDFEAWWRSALRDGVVEKTALPTLEAPVRADAVWRAFGEERVAVAGTYELQLVPDRKVYDGRFAESGWLQELPDPVHQLTWSNAALMSAATMARLGVQNGDVVRLAAGERTIEAPVLTAHGQADHTVTVALGYGRSGDEEVARGLGVNAYAIRTSSAPYGGPGLRIQKTGETRDLALAQLEFDLHGREEEILLHTTLAAYRRDPDFGQRTATPPLPLYNLAPAAPRQWGMTVDLSTCTGCSACVVACQAENNVPVVGEAGVRKGRRMHWLRIDRYEAGDQLLPEPMLCQQCERAPCEYVCPVNATVHSSDGLNQMEYQRCVGTRFCSNNCPYKVRRFNWFNYNSDVTPLERLAKNPDVTVRARGVMEKCSFCVQRIREAEIHTEVEQRALKDGEIRTACEQACPTQAIVFGDIADPASRVSQSRQVGRGFAVLNELGTAPRIRYLAKIRNPNPELA